MLAPCSCNVPGAESCSLRAKLSVLCRAFVRGAEEGGGERGEGGGGRFCTNMDSMRCDAGCQELCSCLNEEIVLCCDV